MTFLSGTFPVLTPQPSEVKQLKVEVFTQDETNVGCFGIDFFTLSPSEDSPSSPLFKRWPADMELRYSLRIPSLFSSYQSSPTALHWVSCGPPRCQLILPSMENCS